MGQTEFLVDQDLKVDLISLYQHSVYSGLLDGYPSTAKNAKTVKYYTEYAEQLFNCGAVYTIPPTERLVNMPQNRTAAFLPGVVCIAHFRSAQVFRELNNHYSVLSVVWFQRGYAFPVDEEILAKIKEIPFRAICEEYEV